jgi:hypothetical protein
MDSGLTSGTSAESRATHAKKGKETSVIVALLVVILLLVLAMPLIERRRPRPIGPVRPPARPIRPPAGPIRPPVGPARHSTHPGDKSAEEAFHVSTMPLPDALAGDDAPERHSVYSALNRLYSTADVDPIITGQLYAFSDGVRNVYAERTSHGDVHGLEEYSSSGGPGDVGVDVGPYGLAEYGGKEVGFDDGIPEPYSMPSTPIRWYGPKQRDHYGPEGPTVYSEGLYSLWEPDHDPLVGGP